VIPPNTIDGPEKTAHAVCCLAIDWLSDDLFFIDCCTSPYLALTVSMISLFRALVKAGLVMSDIKIIAKLLLGTNMGGLPSI
jgi:hypothetical protein